MPSPRKSTSAPQMGASPIRALVLPLVLTALVLSPVLFADFVRLDDQALGLGQDRLAVVVEMVVDPAVDRSLDLRKIQHHAAIVKPRCLEGDAHPAVVPVQMPALALVMQEPMAVAEVDFSGNSEHRR